MRKIEKNRFQFCQKSLWLLEQSLNPFSSFRTAIFAHAHEPQVSQGSKPIEQKNRIFQQKGLLNWLQSTVSSATQVPIDFAFAHESWNLWLSMFYFVFSLLLTQKERSLCTRTKVIRRFSNAK